MHINYYQVLGVAETASPEEIKTAYRIRAKKYHPDIHKGDPFFEEQFKLVLEAYQILSDQKKRENYNSTISYKSTQSTHSNQNNRKYENSYAASSSYNKTTDHKTNAKKGPSQHSTRNSPNFELFTILLVKFIFVDIYTPLKFAVNVTLNSILALILLPYRIIQLFALGLRKIEGFILHPLIYKILVLSIFTIWFIVMLIYLV